MNRRRAGVLAGVAAAGGLTLAAVSPGCPSDPPGPPDGCPDAVVAVDSPPLPYWPQSTERTTFDATGESFTTAESKYVKLRTSSTPGGCWVGATLTDDGDPATTTWDSYHDRTTFYLSTPDSAVIGTHVVTAGDAFSTNGQNWALDGVRVDFSGDDAIQNDLARSGEVTDSLFDGVQVFMSSRGQAQDGTDQTVTVDGVLVRLEPYPNAYRPNGTGGWWKWSNIPVEDGIPPKLVVRNSVFRADVRGVHGGTTYRLPSGQLVNAINGLPPGSECSGVTLIVGDWAENPDYTDRDLASWRDQCSDLTVVFVDQGGAEMWDELVDQWLEEHA